MTKEEVKQYLRNIIDSNIKIQDKFDKNRYELIYNKSYLRALKLSTITGKPVNKNNFTGGELLFRINTKYNKIWHYSIIYNYLYDHYSNDYIEHIEILKEVLNEYEEYKGYIVR